jgi:hypothetical protein
MVPCQLNSMTLYGKWVIMWDYWSIRVCWDVGLDSDHCDLLEQNLFLTIWSSCWLDIFIPASLLVLMCCFNFGTHMWLILFSALVISASHRLSDWTALLLSRAGIRSLIFHMQCFVKSIDSITKPTHHLFRTDMPHMCHAYEMWRSEIVPFLTASKWATESGVTSQPLRAWRSLLLIAT